MAGRFDFDQFRSGLRLLGLGLAGGVTGRPNLDAELAELQKKLPAPVFWLFGKTQSGKTSIIRYLTGAEDAAIGSGFRPCTKFSREYPFPSAETAVLTFLDTRGVDEPGYDPAEDLAAFDKRAHLVVVTCRVGDFAHGHLRDALRRVRDARPSRPVLLVLTCLHEATLPAPHPEPYPFDPFAHPPGKPAAITGDVPDALRQLVAEQARQFDGLYDRMALIDFTHPDEGFPDPNYGAAALQHCLMELLPNAQRETLLRTEELIGALKDAHLKHASPVIVAHASLAASAGAIPVPFVDLLIIPAVQTRMVMELARVYGQSERERKRFVELAASVGVGVLTRQAMREVLKFIPVVGSAAAAALAYGSTYALGRAYCEYLQRAHEGHVPSAEELKRFYNQQYHAAEKTWGAGKSSPA